MTCYVWARQLYGAPSGLLALGTWCFSPSVLAHGSLMAPDVGAAAMGVLAAYTFWRWLKAPEWSGTLLAGLTLGLAELAKSTWLVLFALWPVLFVVKRRWRGAADPARFGRCAGQLSVMLAIAVLCLNVGYALEGCFTRLGEFRFLSSSLGGEGTSQTDTSTGKNRFAGTWLGALPIPLPRNFILGIDAQKWDFEQKLWSYLNGEWRLGGWWYYYAYAAAVKVPLGTWLLGLLAIAVSARDWRRRRAARAQIPTDVAATDRNAMYYSASRLDELVLLAPAIAVFVLVSSQTGFNHHFRYVLPCLPFAFIWTSKVARSVHLRDWKIAGIAGAAFAWSLVSSLSVYPHSLSYFNELAGGPTGGHYHLGSSNTDWGQDLLYVKAWYDQHSQSRPLGLAYEMPLVDPRLVGIEYGPVPKWSTVDGVRSTSPDGMGPEPGWYALSVNLLHAREHYYDYFLKLQPVAMAGYSIYIYHLTLDDANRLRRELGLDELPPEGARNDAAAGESETAAGGLP